ncbi:sigma-70 family RNA polymerase sigma factor [Streptococcus pantholopis]|uniref:Competence protein ComX n=1 Tax=Streptococcus pantholopis TaxID=1811193 RepID=A0A172Q8X9_9STRE|nr:sigma-70 family RNA polymerase sigma factor [Streptococcus pantholopis]AND79939.1 competence protein ComX [Streptococcus pantholopis]
MREEEFDELYKKVRPIILKLKRSYHIHLWDYNDWLQEGSIVLFRLLDAHPDLCQDELRLYVYFKTKFSNYLKDVIRQQESYKRKFNKMAYEDISQLSHCISDNALSLDDYVAYRELVQDIEKNLEGQEREMFQKLLQGERFAGRRKMIKKLQPLFKDFK